MKRMISAIIVTVTVFGVVPIHSAVADEEGAYQE